jgi:hypothetical protein
VTAALVILLVIVNCLGVSYAFIYSAVALATKFGPETCNIDFLGKETGTRLQVTILTDDSWIAGSLNHLFVNMSLTAYWSNISKVSVTLVAIRVEKQTGGNWKSIGVDLSAIQIEGLNLQIERDFQVQPDEPWEAAFFMVETSLSVTYSDQREVSLSPFYIPHGRLGPVSIQPGRSPLGLPFIGMLFSPFVLVAIAGILVLLIVVVYLFVSRRRGGKSPDGVAWLRIRVDSFSLDYSGSFSAKAANIFCIFP